MFRAATALVIGAILGYAVMMYLDTPDTAPAATEDVAETPAAAVQPPRLSLQPIPTLPRTLIDRTEFDIDADGRVETIELFADVERDSRGRLAWDDGQKWMLLVRDGEMAHILFNEFVQLGLVRYWIISDPGSTEPTTIVIQQEAGAGIRVQAFAYDATRDGFILKNTTSAFGNVIHRSPEPQ